MKTQNAIVTLMTVIASSVATAKVGGDQPRQAPRGQNILPYASYCGIAHIPQTAKAGEYNSLCTTLTDSEKCLALVKLSLAGYELEVAREQDKAQVCLDLFRERLLQN